MKNFNKLLIIALLFVSAYGTSQSGAGMDKIKSLKIAFITERLSLSSEEAAVFWPVYNEHEATLEALRNREKNEIRARLRNFQNMSDQQVQSLMDEFLALEKERNDKNIAFLKRMTGLISARKTFLLIKAEDDFKKRLLQQIQQRRQ
jgi:Cdc6-like AAA superfamily ATPase